MSKDEIKKKKKKRMGEEKEFLFCNIFFGAPGDAALIYSSHTPHTFSGPVDDRHPSREVAPGIFSPPPPQKSSVIFVRPADSFNFGGKSYISFLFGAWGLSERGKGEIRKKRGRVIQQVGQIVITWSTEAG